MIFVNANDQQNDSAAWYERDRACIQFDKSLEKASSNISLLNSWDFMLLLELYVLSKLHNQNSVKILNLVSCEMVIIQHQIKNYNIGNHMYQQEVIRK